MSKDIKLIMRRGLIAFCHIPKTAGMTVVEILKYQFGINYLHTTGWRLGSRYTESALRKELLISPSICCVSGHGIRPFLPMGEIGKNFNWFTILRNPFERIISHYVYDVQVGEGNWSSLESWLKDGHDNYQSRWLAGKADGNLAIEIIKDKFISVGLQEHFLESMLHISTFYQWKRIICPPIPINATSNNQFKQKARAEAQGIVTIIENLNLEDIKLYNFVKNDLWPLQMRDLKNSNVKLSFTPNQKEVMRHRAHNIYRNFVYKPFVFLTRYILPKLHVRA